MLDFEGPKADKFHDDLVKLIKKQHTVVPTEKWNGAAEELDAGKVTEKNVKKVAKKLKIDGVVSGKIEKRRDEYIIQIKLRAGTSGEMVGQRVDTKSDSAHLDGKAQRDLKEELIAAIDDLEANHGGGGDDDADEDKPAKKDKKVAKADKPDKSDKGDDDDSDDSAPKKRPFSKKFDKGSDKTDDDADAKPAKKDKKLAKADKPDKSDKGDDDDADVKPAKKDKEPKKAAKADKPDKSDKNDDDTAAALSTKHDEDESPLPKGKTRAKSKDDDSGDDDKKKKVANKDGDDEADGGSAEAEAPEAAGDLATQLSVSERAIDATVGMSLLLTRRLTWDYSNALTGQQIPPHYGSNPAPGATFDVAAYPLSWGHKRHDVLAGLGIELGYDKVLSINSQKLYGPDGMQKVANLSTSAGQFKLAAVFRYPLGKGEKAPIVGGKLGYISQSFTIQQQTPDGMSTDLPNVQYSIIMPAAFVRYPAMPKLVLGAEVGYLLVSGVGTAAGDMGNMSYYGPTSASGYQLAVNGDYQLTPRIFARGEFSVQSIGMTFSNDPNKAGTQVFNRDSNMTTQDVTAAHDLWFGMTAMIGFLY